MKQYIKFYKEAKGELPRIYCDMDGVLCDFEYAANKATGQVWGRSNVLVKTGNLLEKQRTFGLLCLGQEMEDYCGTI